MSDGGDVADGSACRMPESETHPRVDGPGFAAEIPHVKLAIVNRKGLHARASAKFVQTVERYEAVVTVTRCGETVGGRSIMGLLTLGAAQGTTILVTANGPQAAQSLQALTDLLANRFGEDE